MPGPTECIICGHEELWHTKNQSRHPFTKDGDSLEYLGKRESRRQAAQAERPGVKVLRGLPSDPALRILMMRKGLITQDELTEVEREIRQAQEEGSIVIVHAPGADSGGSDRHDSGLRDAGGTGGGVRAAGEEAALVDHPLDGERGE